MIALLLLFSQAVAIFPTALYASAFLVGVIEALPPVFVDIPAVMGEVSTALLFVPRLRFLTTYLFFGSTLAVATSLALYVAVLLSVPAFFHPSSVGWVVIIRSALGIGGAVGLAVGLFLARTINRRIAWFSKLTHNST